jgi:hypothetical protein
VGSKAVCTEVLLIASGEMQQDVAFRGHENTCYREFQRHFSSSTHNSIWLAEIIERCFTSLQIPHIAQFTSDQLTTQRVHYRPAHHTNSHTQPAHHKNSSHPTSSPHKQFTPDQLTTQTVHSRPAHHTNSSLPTSSPHKQFTLN